MYELGYHLSLQHYSPDRIYPVALSSVEFRRLSAYEADPGPKRPSS